MRALPLAVDRSGSMEHQSSCMLDLLGAILQKRPVMLTVFDTDKSGEKYRCDIEYSEYKVFNDDGQDFSGN